MTIKQNFMIIMLSAAFAICAKAQDPTNFSLRSATGKSTFTLSEQKGKYVALQFLLKTECPVCLRHTQEYLSRAGELPGVVQVFIKPDTEAEIQAWARNLSANELSAFSIYRDPDASLANRFSIPGGYAFHGQTVHYPALILIGPDGREVFRYVGKNNADRYSFDQLVAKMQELSGAHPVQK
jgi:peroxiredoxin Q/BCP